MIIYLSGPMTGADQQPDGKFPAFDAAAAHLRDMGYLVISPAENFGGADAGWDVCMKQDIHALLTADAMAVLPGWHQSSMIGVRVELILAATLGVDIHLYDPDLGLGPAIGEGLTNRERAAHFLATDDPRRPCAAAEALGRVLDLIGQWRDAPTAARSYRLVTLLDDIARAALPGGAA